MILAINMYKRFYENIHFSVYIIMIVLLFLFFVDDHYNHYIKSYGIQYEY